MAGEQGVEISQAAGNYTARGKTYEVSIAADGCLVSLKTGGAEFFHAVPSGIPRGVYLFQDGLLPGKVTQEGANVLVASNAKGVVRYEFQASQILWKIRNLTEKPLSYVAVFDSGVTAVQGQRNRWAKTPATKRWTDTLWMREHSAVRILGGTRIWGPWGGNHQVWQADIPPKGNLDIQVSPAAATDAEFAQAEQTIHAPPPSPPQDPSGAMWDLSVLSQPPQTWPAEDFSPPAGPGKANIKPIFFQGPAYGGKKTRVFAWLGLPAAPAGTKSPGMVLIHGGGGTAFASWVERWTSRGYAAIAMDTCGCVPRGTYGHWERHDDGGPPGWGGWDQIDEPREDQWTYHAVADAILAHSLLLSLPEVDASRTGLTGISWGGYLTCLVSGVDPRFRCSVPVYGCGFTNEHTFAASVNNLGAEGSARWMRWWDPSAYLSKASLPMCWVTGSNDFAYTFNALQKSYRLPSGPRTLCVRLRMPHGHGDAGEGPKEIFSFADSILRGGAPLPRLLEQGRQGTQVWAAFQSPRKLLKAELNITRDLGKWPARKWEALPAQVDAAGRVTAALPEGVTVYYLNVFDDRECVVSTEHEELARDPAPAAVAR